MFSVNVPPLLAPVLRERPVGISLLAVGVVLVVCQMLGVPGYACPFHAATGLPCPGCGLTRGTAALLHGRWAQSLEFHPFAVIVLLFLPLLVGSVVLPEPERRRWLTFVETVERRTGIGWLVVLSLLAFGVWRIASLVATGAAWP